ncbi:hypothetical protein ACFQY0_13875 [Haloferula chungangensis]|uniref:DUF2059 domain-containing protein n=1 Tax=Haloferula chungangensis TaxID=1048331 RepID=A0ABW2LA95_9BACT
MKPQHTIAFVVVAVLATVVIEETRISKMRAEIIRLQAIPRDTPSDIEALVSESPEIIELEPKTQEPTPEPEPTLEADAESPALPSTGRIIPSDFPEPDKETVAKLALSSYSDFALETGLSNRELAYLTDLLEHRKNTLQDTASKWLTSPPSERSALEDTMTLVVAKSDEEIATFLGNPTDAKAFARYHAMQPERDQVAAMAALLDEAGATLDMEKEKQLVETLHQARVGTGSIDWNSPAGLRAIGEGGANERFEKEWQAQSEALAGLLPKFLSESEAAAVLQSREGMKNDIAASIESAVEAINRGSE